LGKVERGKGGIERHRDDRVGEGEVVVQKPHPLRPEEEAACPPLVHQGPHLARRLARRHDPLHHVAVARRRGEDVLQIADRRLKACRRAAPLEHRIGAARR